MLVTPTETVKDRSEKSKFPVEQSMYPVSARD
jgi:hypothetical protein